MDDQQKFTIKLTQQNDYQFVVDFGGAVPELLTDETAPLGREGGPDPARMLGAAVANCLAASLLFSMRKFKNKPEPLTAAVTVTLQRNEQGRFRIADIEVELDLGVPQEQIVQLERILAQFEEFCIVTQSVRSGVPVKVSVFDSVKQRLN